MYLPWHDEAQNHGKGQIRARTTCTFPGPKLPLKRLNADFEQELPDKWPGLLPQFPETCGTDERR